MLSVVSNLPRIKPGLHWFLTLNKSNPCCDTWHAVHLKLLFGT